MTRAARILMAGWLVGARFPSSTRAASAPSMVRDGCVEPFRSGGIDPERLVLAERTRPLVFYGLDSARGPQLLVKRDPHAVVLHD